MFDLSGRRALVTGATGGIGHAIAQALHSQGAAVALSGSRKDVLAERAEALGSGAYGVPADLSDPDAPQQLLKDAEQALGGIDILVNNAGITRDNLAMRMKDADWDAVLQINLTASFRLARGVLRGMMKRRWGRIVSITSVVAETGNPGQANYAASKAGLIGMTKSLAHEVAERGITANCVAPGFIETAMTQSLDSEQRRDLIGRIPAGRLGQAQDVAGAVTYLASEAGSYVTGQTLHVNGGMAMP